MFQITAWLVAATSMQGFVMGVPSNPTLTATNLDRNHQMIVDPDGFNRYVTKTNTLATFDFEAADSGTAKFTVVYGDGAAFTECNDGDTIVKGNHTYIDQGFYSTELYISDLTSTIDTALNVSVIVPIQADALTASGRSIVLIGEVVLVNVDKRTDLYPNTVYDLVTCYWSINGVNVGDVLTFGTIDASTTSFSANITMTAEGSMKVGLSCSNFLGATSTNNHIFILVKPRISDIRLSVTNNNVVVQSYNTMQMYHQKIGKVTNFEVTALDGDSGLHTYTVYWGDNTTDTYTMTPHTNFALSHVYTIEGRRYPWVEVTDVVGTSNGSLYIDPLYNHESSGVYIWDYCSTCFQMDIDQPSPAVVYMDGNTAVTYKLSIPSDTDPAKTPKWVTCDWQFPGGVRLIKDPAFAEFMNATLNFTRTKSFTHTYSSSIPNPQITTVTCQGPIGSLTMSVNVTVVQPLTSVSLASVFGDGYHIVANKSSPYNISVGGASHGANIKVVFDADFAFVDNCDIERNSIEYNYTFEEAGFHNISVLATDGRYSFNQTIEVLAIAELSPLTLYVNDVVQSHIIVFEPNTTVDFSVIMDPAVNLPIKVVCTFDFGDGNITDIEVGELSPGSDGAANVSHFYEYILGQHNKSVIVNCSNPVSQQEMNATIGVYKPLSNLSLSAPQYTELGFNTTFLISGTGGELWSNFELDYDNTIIYTTGLSLLGSFEVPYLYLAPGHYFTNLKGYDDAGIHYIPQPTEVVIQKHIDTLLTFEGPPFVAYPNSMTAQFYLTMPTLPVDGFPPSEVNCTFTFPQYSQNVTVSNISHWFNIESLNYTLVFGDGEDQIMKVFCFNMVDNFTSELTVHVNRSLENFTVSVADQINQTALVVNVADIYINCEDVVCYIPNNNIMFSIAAFYGAGPIIYTFNGTTFSLPTHENTLKEVQFGPSSAPGLRNINATAVEQLSSTNYFSQIDFYMQVDMSILSTSSITGPTTVITPSSVPLDYSLTMISNNIQNPPTNASCIFQSPSSSGTAKILSDETAYYPISGRIMFDISDGTTQTVSLNCSNKVSHYVLTMPVTLVKRVNNVVFEVSSPWGKYCQTNLACDFVITGNDGQTNITYVIYLNGSINELISTDIESCGAHKNWTFPKVFTNPEAVAATLRIEDSAGLLTYMESLFVQHPLVPTDHDLDTSPYGLYEDINSVTTHAISLLHLSGNHPTNVSCNWSWPNGTQSVITASEYNWTDTNLVMTLDPSTSLIKTVTVFCENEVSNMTKEVTIILKQRIRDIILQLTSIWGQFAETNAITLFLITAHDGNYSVKNELFPTIPLNGSFTSEFLQDPFVNHSMTHNYNLPGEYVIGLSMHDLLGEIIVNPIVIFVEQRLETIQLTINLSPGVTYATWGPSGVAVFWVIRAHLSPALLPFKNVNFTLTHTRGANTLTEPTNVTCIWSHMEGPTTTTEFTFEPGPVANHTAPVTELPGYQDTSVNCSNHVSVLVEAVQYIVMEKIDGLLVTADKYIAGLNDVFNFNVTRTSGNNVTYSLDYKDSLTDTAFYATDYSPAGFSHAYTSQGHYNVTVTASNPAGDSLLEQISPVHYIDVQLILDKLTLHAVTTSTADIINPFKIPIGEATFKILPDVVYGIPLTVYFDWYFGDGTTFFGEKPPTTWTDSFRSTNYTTASIGQVPVHVRAYNNISEQTEGLKINITLIETITGLGLTSDKRYVQPNETVTFTAAATTGSHIHYSITYSDGLSDSTAYNYALVFQPDVLNRVQVFQHSYSNPGNYTVTVTATNHYSTQSATLVYDVTVLYPVPDLNVTGLTPVLTPPGLMSFNLSRTDGLTFIPNDITCNWTYNGVLGDSFYYFPNWDLPESISYQYKPDRWTIRPTVTLEVSCSNWVTLIPKTTSMVIDIIDHLVIFMKLKDNGPVQYNESLTWVLDVNLYGHNPCFLWTYTNTSFKVLFGRVECKNLTQYIGNYDDFVLSNIGDTQLTYTTSFNIGPIVEVVIEAENSISANDTISDLALVLEKPCDPPFASVGSEGRTPDQPRKVYFSKASTVHGVTTTNCSYTNTFEVKWDAFQYDNSPTRFGVHKIRKTLFKAGISFKPDFTIAPMSLPIGLHYLAFESTMKGLPIDIISEDAMYLEVLPTPIETGIIGGVNRDISAVAGEITILDTFSLSIDPDLGDPANKVNMTWKWQCTKVSVADPPVLSQAYNWTDNSGIGAGDCAISNAVSPSDGKLKLIGGDLTAGQRYRITVQLSKTDGRMATAMQVLKAENSKVLELNLNCTRNCDFWVNPDSATRLIGQCVSCAASDSITYTWKYELKNETTGQYNTVVVNPAPHSVAADGTDVMLEIRPFSLSRGSMYRVTLAGTDSNSGIRGSTSEEYRVNKGPYGGRCTPSELSGTVGLTKFIITCSGWDDFEETNVLNNKRRKKRQAFINAPNLAYIMQANMSYLNSTQEMMLSYGRDAVSSPTYVPLGDAANNYTAPFYVTIIDSFGTSTTFQLLVQSLVPSDLSNKTFYEYLLEVKKVADARDIQTTTQLIWSLLSLHEVAGLETTLDLTNEPDMKLNLYDGPGVDMNQFNDIQTLTATGYYILQLAKLNSNFPNELKQIAELLRKLTGDLDSLNSVRDPKIGMEIVEKAVVHMEQFSNDMTSEELLALSTELLASMGNLLQVSSSAASDMIDTECSFSACASGTIGNITALNKNLMSIANTALDTISKLLARDMMPGEKPLTIDAGYVVLIVQRMRPSSLAGLLLPCKFGQMQLPFNETVYGGVTAMCVDVNYAAFGTNPYTWDISRKNLNAPSQQTRIFDCDTREIQPLQNTTYDDPYQLEHVFENPQTNWTYTELGNTSRDLAYHTFWMNDTSTYAQLYFDTQYFKDMSLELYIIYQDDPNINKFDFKQVLPRGMPEIIPTPKVERMEYIVNDTSNFTNGPYTYVIPKDRTQKIGKYTVGVLAKAFNNDNAAITKVNYTFYVQYISCKLWHDDLNKWTDEDCEMSQESTLKRVKFRSKVFPSSFGAGVVVGPNTINFGTVFDNGLEKLLENIHVLVTIILFLLIYFSLLPYAYKHDKIDRLNWTPFPIIAFVPHYEYNYEIEVYTGRMSKAGTKSKVYVVIAGHSGDTGIVHLQCTERQDFATGSVNKFTISSKIHLGKILCIRIYHDNTGEGKFMDWFLDKVVVIDKIDEKKYLFLCDKWLSIDKGDYKVERTLKLVSKYQFFQLGGMFKRRAVTSVIEDNLWVSTIFKRNEDTFNRVQRATAAIALVFLAMISNAMWYGQGDSATPTAGIQIGPISFTLQSLMVSIYAILTVLPATLVILLLFTKSKRRKPNVVPNFDRNATPSSSPSLGGKAETVADIDLNMNQSNNNSNSDDKADIVDDEGPRKRRRKQKGINFSGQFLPFWCKYVAFFLCFAAVVLSAFFTILYSFEWGGAKSSQWLAAFCLTFFESEVLISPLKAIMLAILISILCKKPVDETDEYADESDEFVFTDDDETDELAEEELAKIRYKRWLMNELQKAFKALIWHLLFLLVLTFVVFGNRDPNSYLCNEELKRVFYDDALEVSTQADFWDYLKDTALPNLFLEEKDNGNVVNKLEKEFVINQVARRLGPPALRQFRVQKNICKAVTDKIKLTCNVDYGSDTADNQDYLLQWKNQPVNYTFPAADKLGIQKAFIYDNGDPTNFNYWGHFGSFAGRGYGYPLGINQPKALQTVEDLITERWMDRYTRAVVFEVNVYNANINLFSLVSILFEFPSYGSALISYEIKTVKLYRYIGGMGLISLLMETVIIIFIIALIVKMVINIVRQKKVFFTSVWNWMEMIKLFCGLGSIGLYVLRTLMIQSTITEMMNNRESLINFRGITLVDEIFVYLLGFALFLQIIQLMWVFKFNKSLAIFGGTLKYTVPDLVGFCVVVFVLFMAFAILHYIYYGTTLWDYRDFLHTSYGQLNLMLGAFRTGDFESVTGMFGRIIFVGYMLSMVFIYMNMLVAIINDVYAGVNEGDYDLGEDYKAMDLLTKAMKSD